MSVVLDASALLAFLRNESGADRVEQYLSQASISSVNWSEVLQKALQKNIDTYGMDEELSAIGLTITPFTATHGRLAADLWRVTKGQGLSFADRACLALARESQLSVVTADRLWLNLDLDLKILSIR